MVFRATAMIFATETVGREQKSPKMTEIKRVLILGWKFWKSLYGFSCRVFAEEVPMFGGRHCFFGCALGTRASSCSVLRAGIVHLWDTWRD